MYNLIITIIAIALTVAATAAAMYYGGDTLSQGRDRADAAAFVTGAQQITGGAQMHAATEGTVPDDVEALITAKYLNSLPVVKGDTWALNTEDRIVTANVASPDTCKAINSQAGEENPEAVTTISGLFGCITASNTFTMKY